VIAENGGWNSSRSSRASARQTAGERAGAGESFSEFDAAVFYALNTELIVR